jgi:hypothetical protein
MFSAYSSNDPDKVIRAVFQTAADIPSTLPDDAVLVEGFGVPGIDRVIDGVIVSFEQPAPNYRVRRMREYPPYTDYLDAVVKNDSEAVDAYIQKCLEIKQKYPKPE